MIIIITVKTIKLIIILLLEWLLWEEFIRLRSIKILLNAHINQYCDIRAFYSISEKPNFNPVFIAFPGYLNLNYQNEVISFENSDGRSDVFMTPTQSLGVESSDIEFKEYSFTADSLPSFRSYRIKLILTSTNQVYVPRLRDLRVIALA